MKKQEKQDLQTAIQEFRVTAEQQGQRLDRLLQKVVEGATFVLIQKLCRKGAVRLDGKRVKGNERVEYGQTVRLPMTLAQPKETKVFQITDKQAADLKRAKLYEDDDIVVVNKPAGLAVQAGSKNFVSLDRLMSGIYPAGEAPKLVHRIDKETSGCVIFAKNTEIARTLTGKFAMRDMKKTYWAVAKGHLVDPEGEIDFSLEKGGGPGHEKMQIRKKGQEALTRYRRKARNGEYHWLEVNPETGRTHQIRAHLSALGVPILGDGKYGTDDIFETNNGKVKNLYLHAYMIQFAHPVTNKQIVIRAPMPNHFQDMFQQLGWQE